MTRRVDAVQRRRETATLRPAAVDRGAVGLGIDPDREPGDDDRPAPRERIPDVGRARTAIAARAARPDDRAPPRREAHRAEPVT